MAVTPASDRGPGCSSSPGSPWPGQQSQARGPAPERRRAGAGPAAPLQVSVTCQPAGLAVPLALVCEPVPGTRGALEIGLLRWF